MNIETRDFLASIGPTGNLVRLLYKPRNCDIFHWCGDETELLAHPQYYGVPLLFPPNRTEHGSFRFQGRIYRMPVNDPVNGFNVHGFLLNRRPETIYRDGDFLLVTLHWTPDDPGFSGFPHEFTLTMEYVFGPASVRIAVMITNLSETDMPYGIGFHTAFAAPQDETVRIRVPNDGKYWRVHPTRRLPDGTSAEIAPEVAAVLDGRAEIRSCALGAQFSASPQGECFEVLRRDVLIRYSVDPKFRFFAVWNAEGKRDLICLEPMSWLANAPNLPLSPERSGVRAIAPGDTVRFMMDLQISASRAGIGKD